MKKELICINCPMGCRMSVTMADGQVTEVTGNHCKRGDTYARQEAVCPMRVLTGNMKCDGCPTPFSVRTDGPIPKSLLLPCAAELKRHHPSRPIRMGDVVIENILNTGVNVVATVDLK